MKTELTFAKTSGTVTRPFKHTIIFFVVPLKFCVGIVFNFSWGDCKSLEKVKIMLTLILDEQQRVL